jgi:hypothetical protein
MTEWIGVIGVAAFGAGAIAHWVGSRVGVETHIRKQPGWKEGSPLERVDLVVRSSSRTKVIGALRLVGGDKMKRMSNETVVRYLGPNSVTKSEGTPWNLRDN